MVEIHFSKNLQTLKKYVRKGKKPKQEKRKKERNTGADLGGGCRGCAPPPSRDDLRFSNTTGILKKKTMWFIGVEVEQETSAPPPKKNPGSAPETTNMI